ncbi:MAG: hypothetical protein AMXMBFR7_15780 [Planctomycetota bacterium]
MQRNLKTCLGLLLAVLLSSCGAINRARGPVQTSAAGAERRHAGPAFAFTHRETWQVTEQPGAEAGEHSVQVQGPGGFFVELRSLQRTAHQEGLPQQVAKALKQAYPNLESKPLQREIGRHDAVGLSFSYMTPERRLNGWVVSRRHGESELCVLAQWPEGAARPHAEALEDLLISVEWPRIARQTATAP